MDRASPYDSSPSGRVPISHPYPPSYRAQLAPHAGTPSTGTPSPAAAPRGEGQLPFRMQPGQEESYMMDYQRRRDQRHSQNSPMYPSDNPYTASSSNPMNRLRSPSESSIIPLGTIQPSGSKETFSKDLATGYPEGWTKEDEDAEREFLSKGMINWGELKSWRFWIRKEWWYYYLILIVIGVLVCLMTLYHDQIVNWLTPVANWMKALPAGWAIPIAIFFVISFPPLFGHEILAILVGAVWGLWIGFGITAAGTFIGEVGNFYAFKYCLRSRAEKYEKTNLNYACMAHVVREGGFLIIFAARLSAIPGHFTTAVFSTCGMNIWIFMIACILTMPKQLIVVYLGVIFEEKDTSSKNKIISDSVLAVGFLVTIGAAWYIWRKMQKARIVVWRKRRMEAAARGLVLNPVTGSQSAKRASYKEWDGGRTESQSNVLGEDDSRSPILRHQSYQNPYDISYRPTDNMSVYDVDGPRERDVSTRHYRVESPENSINTAPAQFPEARSTGQQPIMGVSREPSQAPTMYSEHTRDTAEFPIPVPALPHQREMYEPGSAR